MPSVSGLLSGLQVQIDSSDANPTSFNVRLFSNVPPTSTSRTGSTNTQGVQLAAFTGTATYGLSPYVLSVPVTSYALVAGTRYWLQLDGGSVDATGSSNVAWYQQAGAPATTTRTLNGYGANNSPYGVTVLVNPTPEPATWAALGLGAAAVLRRRKRA